MRLIQRLALALCAVVAACSPTTSAARPGFGLFGFRHHQVGTVIPSVPAAPVYDTTIGNGVGTDGFASLPLNGSASRFFVNSSTGSDSNTCTQAKSPATPKATLTAGEACATNGLGDQILLAEGTSYSSFTMIGALGGASTTYPLVIESYNVADPTNEAKLGRATGANRPVILTSGMTGGFIQGNGQASYRAFRGLKFDAQNAANVAMNVFAAGDGTVANYTLFENDEVAQAQLSFGGNAAAPARKGVTIRMSAFHGAWGSNRAQCLYMETTDGVAIEDSLFWHCGYKEGVSRSADPTVGGSDASGQSHAIYDQVDVANSVARRNVMIDNSTEAVNLKGGGIIHSNLSLNNPIVANNGGGNNATIDIPFGIYSDTSFNAALGSNQVGGTAGAAGWGIHTNYGRQGLAIARYNILARSGFTNYTFMADAPNDVITSNTGWTPPTVPANLPSYIAFSNDVGYLWTSSGSSEALGLSGGNLPSIHATVSNTIWDDPTSGSNTNVGSASFANTYTEATLLAALPGAYASETAAINDWIANTPSKGWETAPTLALAGYGVTVPAASDLATDMRITVGLANSGQFIGTVPNSTLTFSGLPACVTPDNGLRAWRATSACTAGSGTFSVTETPPIGSPHTTTLPWAVYARPVLSSLTVTPAATSATATVSTTVGSGNLYWMVSGSATPPNWANIRVGIDAGLTSAAYVFGSNTISATGSQSIDTTTGHTSTALTSGASYTLHVAQLDANNNPSATVSSTFTTTASFATLDPANKSSGITLTNGNLTATGSTAFGAVRSTKSMTAGKFYWEETINLNADVNTAGVVDSTVSMSPSGYWEANNSAHYATWFGTELRYNSTSSTIRNISGTVGFAFDATNKKLYVRDSTGWMSGMDPVAGTGGLDVTGIGSTMYAGWQGDSSDQATFNFGASSWTYTPPTGYGAMFLPLGLVFRRRRRKAANDNESSAESIAA